jgi:hypothetical protein
MLPSSVLGSMVHTIEALHDAVNVKCAWGAAGGPWEYNLRDLLRWCQLAKVAVASATPVEGAAPRASAAISRLPNALVAVSCMAPDHCHAVQLACGVSWGIRSQEQRIALASSDRLTQRILMLACQLHLCFTSCCASTTPKLAVYHSLRGTSSSCMVVQPHPSESLRRRSGDGGGQSCGQPSVEPCVRAAGQAGCELGGGDP